MSGHQAPAANAHAQALAVIGEQREIDAAVVIGEEDVLPVVAALGDMMRHAGDDDTSGSRHRRRLPRSGEMVKKVVAVSTLSKHNTPLASIMLRKLISITLMLCMISCDSPRRPASLNGNAVTAETLRDLPTWGERDLSVDEWMTIVAIGKSLQQLGPATTYHVYRSYLSAISVNGEAESIQNWTRLMLLNRVMFVLPPNVQPRLVDRNDVWKPFRVYSRPFGGLYADDQIILGPIDSNLSLPVGWTGAIPGLTHFRSEKVSVAVADLCDPTDEFKYFLRHYPPRNLIAVHEALMRAESVH